MSLDWHQWNIPVESYFLMFSSILSICSFPGMRRGSCLIKEKTEGGWNQMKMLTRVKFHLNNCQMTIKTQILNQTNSVLTAVVKVVLSLPRPPHFCSLLSHPIYRNAKKTAMSSSRVTSAAAARRKAMAATYCTDWHEHRDAITPPYCIQLLTYLCCAVKALTDQTLNISVICPIIFAFQSEVY